jgi:hypothetical protein
LLGLAAPRTLSKSSRGPGSRSSSKRTGWALGSLSAEPRKRPFQTILSSRRIPPSCLPRRLLEASRQLLPWDNRHHQSCPRRTAATGKKQPLLLPSSRVVTSTLKAAPPSLVPSLTHPVRLSLAAHLVPLHSSLSLPIQTVAYLTEVESLWRPRIFSGPGARRFQPSTWSLANNRNHRHPSTAPLLRLHRLLWSRQHTK